MDKRQAILTATAKLITERGLQSTPMSLIAKKSKVGAGTIYRYFEDKEALVTAVYEELVKDISTVVFRNLSESGDSTLKEKFIAFWRSVLKFFLENPENTTLFGYLKTSPYVKAEVREAIDQKMQQKSYNLFIKEMEEKSLLRNLGAGITINFIYGGLLNLSRKNSAELDEKCIEQILEMCWEIITS